MERYRSFTPAPDAVLAHSTYYRVSSCPEVPLVTTVHDFTYERYWSGPALSVHRAQKRRAILRSAAGDLHLAFDPGRPSPLRSGNRLAKDPRGSPGSRRKLCSHERRATPSALHPFRWEEGQLQELFACPAGHRGFHGWDVMCVGGEKPGDHDFEPIPAFARNRVRLLGVIEDAALNRLYNQAICLAYTSEYEGFGIPVVEAMRAGCPVVTSGCASVLEVARGACRVVPHDDPGALARACRDVARPELREELKQAGLAAAAAYSWEDCYRKTVEIYDEVERAAARSNSA